MFTRTSPAAFVGCFFGAMVFIVLGVVFGLSLEPGWTCVVVAGAALTFFAWLSMSSKFAATRALRRVSQATCPTCQAPFGLAAAEQALAQYQADVSAAIAATTARVHFAPEWPVTCSQCKQVSRVHPNPG